LDPANIDKNANGTTPTGNPNEFKLLDLTPLFGAAGTYLNSTTGDSDWGPFPSTMTERDAFRGPGAWNLDMSVHKRFRFLNGYALQVRLEAFNVFNHRNMFVHSDAADVSAMTASTAYITGYKDGNRNVQIGAKFEF